MSRQDVTPLPPPDLLFHTGHRTHTHTHHTPRSVPPSYLKTLWLTARIERRHDVSAVCMRLQPVAVAPVLGGESRLRLGQLLGRRQLDNHLCDVGAALLDAEHRQGG